MMKHLRGSILLLTAAVIWGTAFVAQSEGMNYVGPFTYNAVRTLLSGIVMIPVILGMQHHERRTGTEQVEVSRKATVQGGLFCGLALFAASSLQQIGMTETTAGKAGFVTAIYVVLVPIFSVLMHRKLPRKIWICIAAAMTGFYFICIREGFSVSYGDLMTLGSAFFFAMHILCVDHFCRKNADGKTLVCIQFLTAGLLMAISMIIFEHPVLTNILAAKDAILYAGIMSCGVAYTFQFSGQRETPPTLATLLMSLEAVFAAISGCFFLNEQLSARELFGCMLVLGAVIAAQLMTTRQQIQTEGKECT